MAIKEKRWKQREARKCEEKESEINGQ